MVLQNIKWKIAGQFQNCKLSVIISDMNDFTKFVKRYPNIIIYILVTAANLNVVHEPPVLLLHIPIRKTLQLLPFELI